MKTVINRGSVYWCFDGEKVRPVVIISESDTAVEIDVNYARITSSTPRSKYDIPIEHWKEAGLRNESIVRCKKIQTINHLDLKRKIGDLHKDDLRKILQTLIEITQEEFNQEFPEA